jgi:hypothetical protein
LNSHNQKILILSSKRFYYNIIANRKCHQKLANKPKADPTTRDILSMKPPKLQITLLQKKELLLAITPQ